MTQMALALAALFHVLRASDKALAEFLLSLAHTQMLATKATTMAGAWPAALDAIYRGLRNPAAAAGGTAADRGGDRGLPEGPRRRSPDSRGLQARARSRTRNGNGVAAKKSAKLNTRRLSRRNKAPHAAARINSSMVGHVRDGLQRSAIENSHERSLKNCSSRERLASNRPYLSHTLPQTIGMIPLD